MKLVDYFEKNREKVFLQFLQNANSVGDVLEAIVRELEFYSVPGNEYLSDLTPGEARISLALLSLTRQLNAGDTYNSVSESRNSPQPQTSSAPNDKPNNYFKYIWVTIGSGAGAGIGSFLGPFGGILGAALGGFSVTALLNRKEELSILLQPEEPTRKDEIKIDTVVLVQSLKGWMAKIDEIVKEHAPKPVAQKEIELHHEFPEILRMFQTALSLSKSDSMDRFVDLQLPQFESILLGAGYEMRQMTQEIPESQYSRYYEIAYKSGASGMKVLAEPVFKGEELIRQGRLFLPKA